MTVYSRKQRTVHQSDQLIQYHCWKRIQDLLAEDFTSSPATSIWSGIEEKRIRADGRRKQTYNLIELEVKILNGVITGTLKVPPVTIIPLL